MIVEEELSYKVRGAIYEVYNQLGTGLLESVYATALKYELENKGLKVLSEVPIPIVYKGVMLKTAFRLDLLVEDKIILELKSVEEIKPIYKKQLLTYLKLTHKKVGFLVNFNEVDINKGIARLVA